MALQEANSGDSYVCGIVYHPINKEKKNEIERDEAIVIYIIQGFCCCLDVVFSEDIELPQNLRNRQRENVGRKS